MPEEALGFTRLKSPELERQFRDERLPRDATQLAVVVMVVMAAVVAFALTDRAATGAAGLPGRLALGRLLVLVASVALLALLRRPISVRQFDRAVLAWTMLVVFELLLLTATRAGSPTFNATVVVTAIIAVYGVIPAPLWVQMVPTLLGTVGYVALWRLVGGPGDVTQTGAILTCLALANAFGIMGARLVHRRNRRRFTAGLTVRETTEALERAEEGT